MSSGDANKGAAEETAEDLESSGRAYAVPYIHFSTCALTVRQQSIRRTAYSHARGLHPVAAHRLWLPGHVR